jgi:alpha-tubulin suppressor-like RCC1 family protein
VADDPPLQKFSALAAGYFHSLFVTEDGKLWATGGNEDGQLGDGTTTNRTIPAQVPVSGDPKVIAVAAGFSHSLFLTEDGKLWGMGGNLLGQLGDGTRHTSMFPLQIPVPNNPNLKVTTVVAGRHFSLFLTEDGELWGMGSNGDGQLGDGTGKNSPIPLQISVPGNRNLKVIAVAAGAYHSLFVTEDGKLWATGDAHYGQLGDGSSGGYNNYRVTPVQIAVPGNPNLKVTAVSAGEAHSLFLTEDGKLWGMGSNSYGEFGGGVSGSISTPVQVLISGRSDLKVIAISAGQAHSLFLTEDGKLWATGSNRYGALGNENSDYYQYTPLQVSVPGNP